MQHIIHKEKIAAGFTSTTFEPVTENQAAVLEDNVVR